MKDQKTLRLVAAAMMAAMACVATMVIKIPIPATGGYINPGDGIILLSGILLGPVYGGLAAGIGSSLADLLGGYAVYAPATLFIKFLMAAVAGLLVEDVAQRGVLGVMLAGLISETIMVAGYFAFEAVVMGYGLAAAGAVAGNVLQGAAGIAIASALTPVLKRVNLPPLRRARATAKQKGRAA